MYVQTSVFSAWPFITSQSIKVNTQWAPCAHCSYFWHFFKQVSALFNHSSFLPYALFQETLIFFSLLIFDLVTIILVTLVICFISFSYGGYGLYSTYLLLIYIVMVTYHLLNFIHYRSPPYHDMKTFHIGYLMGNYVHTPGFSCWFPFLSSRVRLNWPIPGTWHLTVPLSVYTWVFFWYG